jgi:hypothetical protein
MWMVSSDLLVSAKERKSENQWFQMWMVSSDLLVSAKERKSEKQFGSLYSRGLNMINLN